MRAQNVKIATGLIRFHCCASILSIKHVKLISFTKSIERMLYCCPFKSCIVFISFYGLFYFALRCVSPTTASKNKPHDGFFFYILRNVSDSWTEFGMDWITFHSLANLHSNLRMTHRTKFRKWNIWAFIRSLFIAFRAVLIHQFSRIWRLGVLLSTIGSSHPNWTSNEITRFMTVLRIYAHVIMGFWFECGRNIYCARVHACFANNSIDPSKWIIVML